MSIYGMAISDPTQSAQFHACAAGVKDHPYYHKCYDCLHGPATCPIGMDILKFAYWDYQLEERERISKGDFEPLPPFDDWFLERQKTAHELRYVCKQDIPDKFI